MIPGKRPPQQCVAVSWGFREATTESHVGDGQRLKKVQVWIPIRASNTDPVQKVLAHCRKVMRMWLCRLRLLHRVLLTYSWSAVPRSLWFQVSNYVNCSTSEDAIQTVRRVDGSPPPANGRMTGMYRVAYLKSNIRITQIMSDVQGMHMRASQMPVYYLFGTSPRKNTYQLWKDRTFVVA